MVAKTLAKAPISIKPSLRFNPRLYPRYKLQLNYNINKRKKKYLIFNVSVVKRILNWYTDLRIEEMTLIIDVQHTRLSSTLD